jgi:hypothetical protein
MDEEQGRITDAIRRLLERVHWRPGKDTQHLAKRIELGHLPVATTLAEYEAIIIRVISTSTAEVFVYRITSPLSTPRGRGRSSALTNGSALSKRCYWLRTLPRPGS